MKIIFNLVKILIILRILRINKLLVKKILEVIIIDQ